MRFSSSVVKNCFIILLKFSEPNFSSRIKQIYSPFFFSTALLPFNNSANVLTNFSYYSRSKLARLSLQLAKSW